MRNPARTPAEELRLNELAAARRSLTQSILTLSDVENAYLASSMGIDAALTHLREAREKAARATRGLNSAENALGKLNTVTGIITDLLTVF